MPSTQGHRICAVIVAYQPDVALLRELVVRLLPQVGKLFVVDNTPAGDDVAEVALGLWAPEEDAVVLVRNGRNLGIGAALNIGVQAARYDGFEYVLLSDQDSRPATDMVSYLLNASIALKKSGILVACTCPAFIDLVTGQSVPFQVQLPGQRFYSKCLAQDAVPWAEILTAITSGSLISLEALDRVGRMNEGLFIDYVDTDWCHRAHALGLKVFGIGQAKLEHRLGEGSFRVWYMRWRWFNDCSPHRMYYRIRNFIFLCQQSYVPVNWKVRTAWNWVGNIYAYCVYSPQRWKHLRWMFKGMLDGVRGKFDGE